MQSRQIKIMGHTFRQVEFTKDGIVNGSIDQNSRTSSFEGGTDVRRQYGYNSRRSMFKKRRDTCLS